MSLLDGISSEDFIKALTKAPYVNCPVCGAKNTAGTCVIARRSFSRRCFKCGENSSGGSLPDLDKKIIYLDQCALGFMLRALIYKEGETKEKEDQEPVIENFLKAFEKIDILNKKQLLICPKSDFHFKETSIMSEERAKALTHVNTLLSSTNSFFEASRIITRQTFSHFSAWLQGETFEFNDDKKEATSSTVDDWNMWINVVVNHKLSEEYVESLQTEKEDNHKELGGLFAKWQKENGKSYDEFRTLELSNFGLLMTTLPSMQSYSLPDVSSMIELLFRSVMYPDYLHQISRSFFGICEKYGVSEDKRAEKIHEYFLSEEILQVPFFQISSALTALVAHRASQNEDMKVDGNNIIDILFMSLFLPYTDAVLMETKWHRDLLTLPLTYKAKVFSFSNMPDFFTYLNDIESSASQEIIDKAKNVYGDLKPYYTVHKL